jgi:molybdopterin converting factor subunit 1
LSATGKVKVLYFANAKDAVGKVEETLTLRPGASVSILLRQLIAAHPQLAPMGRSLRFAINQEVVDSRAVLGDGDEVAVLPPVAGG